jgi:hypothetical protein
MKLSHFFRALAPVLLWSGYAVAGDASRLAYLDENDPFYPGRDFPKLTTPQWVGEPDVEAVVILAVDDMQKPQLYETFLRPIVDRLRKIDGRAPISIMANRLDPTDPVLQGMLRDGLSIEVHTLDHPCPLLAGHTFDRAASEVNDCIDLMDRIPGNEAVAFRMPCCDSLNSLSPRFLAEIFNGVSTAGHFLALDSSVFNITTSKDASLPADLTTENGGGERFRKYVPFPAFATTIEDYPYPYVIGKLCWEFPPAAPSDWEAQHLHGTNNPATVADWEKLLDATVLKQGTFNFVFHPHGWIKSEQMAHFVDYAATRYGNKVKFLTFREALERLNKNLLAGQPLRAANGQDNGVRLLDLDNDGHLDVVIGNRELQMTRRWDEARRQWIESGFPVALIAAGAGGKQHETGLHFGVLQSNGMAFMLVRNDTVAGGWRFDGTDWVADKDLLNGLQVQGKPVYTTGDGHDRGVRLRDVLHSGAVQVIVGNPDQDALFAWSPAEKAWKQAAFALPAGTTIVDSEGNDAGLRFVDINNDGYDDVVFSNEKSFGAYIFSPKKDGSLDAGWRLQHVAGPRDGHQPEIPMIVRGGPHPANGAWFKYGKLWVQNEDTALLPDVVERRTFQELIASSQPRATSP